MKKLWKLLPALLVGTACVPAVFSLTSCSPTLQKEHFKYIDFSKDFNNLTSDDDDDKELNWDDFTSPNRSINDLLYGDKKFNNGNYALVLGCSSSGESYGQESLFYNWSSTPLLNTLNINNSPIYEAWHDTLDNSDLITTDGSGKGVAFVTLFDICPIDTSPKPTDLSIEPSDLGMLSPFATWNEQDEKGPDGKDTGHKKDTYIRNDNSAKYYRDLCSKISILFSGCSDLEGINAGKVNREEDFHNGYIIFWKKGVPTSALALKTHPDAKSITTKIEDTYKKDDKDTNSL